jgi:DNA invertase Pin-like site-specific DNA recombinase
MGATAYYMRTSHYLQSIGTQIDRIEADWIVYQDEGISGRIPFKMRPAGKKLLDDVSTGKISKVVTLRIDRLGRSTQDILETINKISMLHKVPVVSINEGITPMTGLLTNILSSLSEFFYHTNREKIMAGVERAKLLNRYKGRKTGSKEDMDKFLSKPKNAKIKELLDAKLGIRSISRVLGCSPNLIYKVKEQVALIDAA